MKAYLKNYRQSPRKVRLIANLVRGRDVEQALTLLSLAPKRAAEPMKKLLESAVSNAKNVGKEKRDLAVKEIQVNQGFVFKRFRARARGRATPIRRKSSHISITLGEQKPKKEKSKTTPKKEAVAKKSAPKKKAVAKKTAPVSKKKHTELKK